jgi:hypothetical protein
MQSFTDKKPFQLVIGLILARYARNKIKFFSYFFGLPGPRRYRRSKTIGAYAL